MRKAITVCFFLILFISLVTCSGGSRSGTSGSNKSLFIVTKDGSGDYSTIQSAIDNSKPGDTIQVKNGVYNERVKITTSGTEQRPITLINYPGHTPVIDPGGGKYSDNESLRVEFNAEWIILEGFEIRYGRDGVKLYKGHNTVRNNWIHHNRYQGILIVSTNDVFIEGNTIENNGTDPGACYSESWGGESPKHCHGIYMSDYLCTGMSNITIRGNAISNHGGRGVQWNGKGCTSLMQNTLVENNIIENNSWGLVMYFNVERSVIRNNTFVMESYPNTNDTSHTFLGIYGSVDNIFKNNIFYSNREDVAAIETFDEDSGQNIFDFNLWKVSSNSWKWKDSWRGDFTSKYSSTTGWDHNSLCCSIDPRFYNLATGIYNLTADSPAIDRGDNKECSSIDYDLELRLEKDNICDIGMDEITKN